MARCPFSSTRDVAPPAQPMLVAGLLFLAMLVLFALLAPRICTTPPWRNRQRTGRGGLLAESTRWEPMRKVATCSRP